MRYVAEHHENLQHVLVFVGVDEGLVAGLDLEAIVPPSLGFHSSGDTLILRCGSSSSAPLNLPVRVAAGKKEVRVQIGHYEIKLTTSNLDDSPHHSSTLAPSAVDDSSSRLLDAEHLAKLSPTTFICSCCSLALIQPPPAGGLQYRDLPSEHWAELLDAWMCHSDQKLHEHIAKHSNALWPAAGQALLGGSYILFEESSIVGSNTRVLKSDSKVRFYNPCSEEGDKKVVIGNLPVGKFYWKIRLEGDYGTLAGSVHPESLIDRGLYQAFAFD